ncbi:MAG: outer membrane protein transport protein [Mariprofundaceae bacterium]|nr:outer membrane protein transport protein [Mariprofundaceae bacterium]
MMNTWAHASSFVNDDISVSAMGQANAVVAQSNDASVMAHNPAGIAWLQPIEMTIGFSQSSDHVRLNGGLRSQQRATSSLEHLYVAWVPRDSRIAFGVGYNRSHSLNRDWGQTAFAGQAKWTLLSMYHANTDMVYAIQSNMAVAIGLDGYFGELNLDTATSQFQAKRQTSFGAHAGVRWEFTPHWNWGISWRSATTMSFDGKSAGAVTGNSRIKVRLPDQMQTGLAWDVLDNLRIETDALWRGFSATENLNLVGSSVENIPLKLKNTWDVMLGLNWTWHENNQLRFGYTRAQGNSTLANYNPRLSDLDHHRIHVGLGMEIFNSHLDLAYTHSFYPQKQINNTAFTGLMKNNHSAIAFSWSKKL